MLNIHEFLNNDSVTMLRETSLKFERRLEHAAAFEYSEPSKFRVLKSAELEVGPGTWKACKLAAARARPEPEADSPARSTARTGFTCIARH
jgi:hypothetical protein